MLLNNMEIDSLGGVYIKTHLAYYTYQNDILTGETLSYISDNFNNGLYVMLNKNSNEFYEPPTYDTSLVLTIDTGVTITDWFSSYCNDLATTGYSSDYIFESGYEERVIYDSQMYESHILVHSGTTNVISTPMNAILNYNTGDVWMSGDTESYYYYELDDCGNETGRMLVSLMDINEFSDTKYSKYIIERPRVKKYKPTVETLTLSTPTFSGVTITGGLTNSGTTAIDEVGFVFSIYSNPTIDDIKVESTLIGTGFTSDLSLVYSKDYYVRAYATNSIGVGYGNELIFSTPNIS